MKSFKSKTINGFAEIALQQYQLKKIKAGSACCPDGGGDQPPPPECITNDRGIIYDACVWD